MGRNNLHGCKGVTDTEAHRQTDRQTDRRAEGRKGGQTGESVGNCARQIQLGPGARRRLGKWFNVNEHSWGLVAVVSGQWSVVGGQWCDYEWRAQCLRRGQL